ncbi:MAG TPA: DoxX family protein [Ktedonobacterales bacterium]
MGTVVSIGALALEGLLGLFMVYAVYLNFTNSPLLVKSWTESGMPRWYTRLAGVLGAIGALALLVGVFIPTVGALALLWMVAYFIVATLTHVVVRDTFATTSIPLVFLALSIAGVALRWSSLSPVLAAIRLG